MNLELTIHAFSVGLAGAAMALAFYNIRLTGRVWAWYAFFAGFILLAAERVVELLAHAGVVENGSVYETARDSMHMLMTLFFLIGVYTIRKMFVERREAQGRLQQQLDELHRFQQNVVGRELRMKELSEENQALKAGLTGQQHDGRTHER